jgi:hypothetical protein
MVVVVVVAASCLSFLELFGAKQFHHSDRRRCYKREKAKRERESLAPKNGKDFKGALKCSKFHLLLTGNERPTCPHLKCTLDVTEKKNESSRSVSIGYVYRYETWDSQERKPKLKHIMMGGAQR